MGWWHKAREVRPVPVPVLTLAPRYVTRHSGTAAAGVRLLSTEQSWTMAWSEELPVGEGWGEQHLHTAEPQAREKCILSCPLTVSYNVLNLNLYNQHDVVFLFAFV